MFESILIVEDNDRDHELIEYAVKKECGDVRRARSLEEGVAEVKRLEPEVVLLDVGGIGADSPHHAVSEIKRVRTKAAIVIISGNSNPMTIDECILSTASGYIVKGRWENLLHELRAAFRNHRASLMVQELKNIALSQDPTP